MDNKIVNTKTIRRRRSECAWRKSPVDSLTTTSSSASSIKGEDVTKEYPPGPIDIYTSWNPLNRSEKPPYSYATIIGHSILTSKERRLTLNEIYVWITEHYPFYSSDTQGWQNSIRHNLSLHKAFVKIERDSSIPNPPRKGCFWTIRPGKEKSFIDNLQKPMNSVRRQQSLSHLVSSSATIMARRQQLQRRASTAVLSTTTTTTNDQRLFNTFRDTVTSTAASTTVPEAEPITSSSSSSDHNQSPINSTTSSPTYHQLMMSDTNATYQVYPDENTTELFNSSHDDYAYSTTSNPYPPSLSQCDAYSTTSSSFADTMYYSPPLRTASRDRLYTGPGSHLLYKGYPSGMMDWTTTTSASSVSSTSQPSMLKHDHNTSFYGNTISPPYYYMQQQPRLPHHTSTSDFSPFLHR